MLRVGPDRATAQLYVKRDRRDAIDDLRDRISGLFAGRGTGAPIATGHCARVSQSPPPWIVYHIALKALVGTGPVTG